MTISQDNKFLLALSQFHKFGPRKLGLIRNYFSSWEQGFLASAQELMRAGIEPALAEEFIVLKRSLDIEGLLNLLDKKGINIAILGEDNYPNLLGKISDPPFIIYYKGSINLNGCCPLAVVGARKYTDYGVKIINTVVSDLAAQGISIISGLAIGIDSLAHNKALEKGAQTIAVLGSGINKIYPMSNFQLSQKIIASGGGIISEFPPDYEAFKQNFPQRNRLVSGLSLGVMVVEARLKSGSLITAGFALEQGREVLAVAGDADRPSSEGTNNLIKKGAACVTQADDVLQTLGLEKQTTKPTIPDNLSSNEKLILGYLSKDPLHKEDLIKTAKLDTKLINSTLSILEIKNIVKNIGNNYYIKL